VGAVGLREGVVVIVEDLMAALAAPTRGSLIVIVIVCVVVDGHAVAQLDERVLVVAVRVLGVDVVGEVVEAGAPQRSREVRKRASR
jgi:hypothetical protein